MIGEIKCERAYYYCRGCGKGSAPFDQTIHLSERGFTKGAEQLVTLAGTVCGSFEEAAQKVLPSMAGLRVSESSVQRTTEEIGQKLQELLDAGHGFGFPKPWDWHKDAEGHTCAYVSLDLTGVRQQAAGGGRAEGRMPYVAMVFNPVPELAKDSPYRPPAKAQMQARYLSGLYDLDKLGPQLRKQASQVGMKEAEVWIGLTDGGSGLEDFVRLNFSRDPILILDFWHASDYLTGLAKVLYPKDEDQRRAFLEQWCHRLKREGGQSVLEELKALSLPEGSGVIDKHTEVVRYFENNVHRMDYPQYLSKGWSIGSGAVESACKTIVGQRLKQAGMRWREYGTDTLCRLRALYKSEESQWKAFWQQKYQLAQAA